VSTSAFGDGDRHPDVEAVGDPLVPVERVDPLGSEEPSLDLPPGASVGYRPSTRRRLWSRAGTRNANPSVPSTAAARSRSVRVP